MLRLVCEDLRSVRVGRRDVDVLAMEGKVAEFRALTYESKTKNL
jgi:hypothetical protein